MSTWWEGVERETEGSGGQDIHHPTGETSPASPGATDIKMYHTIQGSEKYFPPILETNIQNRLRLGLMQ